MFLCQADKGSVGLASFMLKLDKTRVSSLICFWLWCFIIAIITLIRGKRGSPSYREQKPDYPQALASGCLSRSENTRHKQMLSAGFLSLPPGIITTVNREMREREMRRTCSQYV